jgi:myosin-5
VPVKLPLPRKIKIQKVSCGFNNGFLITNEGMVFSFGDNNASGQLGQGHTEPVYTPQMISLFKERRERIDQLECGFKHVIARSNLGKVYTWGDGAKGQLGHGNFKSLLSPQKLKIGIKNFHKAT